MDAPLFLSNPTVDEDTSAASKPLTLDVIAGKIDLAAGMMATARNISKKLVLERLPAIDIVVFGRSGIGKSTLVQAITHVDMLPSSQIDHVTQVLTEVTVEIEPLKFRFWDAKGIDSWLDIDAIDNLFNEIIAREMKPLFVIYCATMNG